MQTPLIILILLTRSSVIVINAFSASGVNKRVFVGTPVQKNRRLVSSCMTPISSFVTLTPSTTVDEAVILLLDLGISGAPVVDPISGAILGVVSSFDFLKQEAGDGILFPMAGSMEEVEEYVEIAGKICATRIGDIMTKNPTCVGAGESMKDAAVLMAKEKLHRLLVVDDDEEGETKLVGMLTSSDVMRDMVHIVKNLPSAD